MAKIVVIGDSLSQGFQSGAILNTTWSYSAMIARSMGLNVPQDFRVPTFPGTGLPLNIEELLRWLGEKIRLGPDIDFGEWFSQFPIFVNQFMDDVEDLYERGLGAQPDLFSGMYHNLAVWGFRVADSFQVTSKYCEEVINNSDGWLADDFFGLPSAAMYRTARRVLNPALQPTRMDWTQLDNLHQIVEDEGEIESLIIWLGANDALQTVTELELRDMVDVDVPDDPEKRRKWNLTNALVFDKDFNHLVTLVKAIIPSTTKVFVGTVGHVIIPPITQGIPPFDHGYFEFYGRFFQKEESFIPALHKKLTRQQAMNIDSRIDAFNETIKNAVSKQGANWYLVETGAILDKLAVKRNQLSHAPDQALRGYYADKGINNHPLLQLSSIPNVLRFETAGQKRVSGGLFSLDCVHPTTIGYGIIGEAFLEKMMLAGIPGADPTHINWQEIIDNDALNLNPPELWDDILSAAEHHPTFWDAIFKVIT